jgi:hypothetical protein
MKHFNVCIGILWAIVRERHRYQQGKMGETTSERNDGTAIAKCERSANPPQKVNRPIGPILIKAHERDEHENEHKEEH